MPGPEPMTINLTWDTTSLTMPVGGTASTTVSNSITNYMQYLTSSDIDALTSSVATSSVDDTTYTVTFTGVAAGTVTIPANTTIQSSQSVVSTNALTITVVDATPKYLDKDGLDYYDSLIATEIDGKQDTLTAGTGISISNNVISATGGGVADSVAWGHVTGTMSDQTDLTTALGAKANSADLATVATSGDYDDLTDKPTIGNATLTIQKNGTSAGTFTANATSNKTINITVPTTAADVSALPASTKYGASIAVSINTTDYKVTTTLKDQDGNTLGTAQVIDLPLESVVVNGSYDSTNKKIVLTLQNGNTIDIPVGDLISGLQSEITSANKLDSDLVDDTNQTHKFMTSAEKTKLSGIAAGAEVNVQSDWDQTTTTADDYIKNKPTLATVATSGSYNDLSNKPTIPTVNNATLTIQKNGTNVQTFTANQSTNATANITVPTKTSDLTNDSGFLDSVAWGDVTGKPTFATVATSGSYNDLSNKPTIPAAQVNSDWNATSGKAQILNKPTLATVATSGSYNDLSNKPTIPAAQVQSDWAQTTTTAVDFIKNKPTKVSDFTNDAGYITSYTDTQVTQTRVDPDTITTFYPVASTSSSTNTGDVKKFSAVKLNYASDDGGYAELELGQNSYYDPVGGELTLWNMGTTQRKTTLHRGLGETNQTFNLPYNADSTSGTLVANGAPSTATGSATQPVYADATGILHPTTYALNKTVPSNAVFTDTTYSDATTSTAGLMSASDKTKLNGIAAGAEVNQNAFSNVKVGSTTVAADSKTDTLELVAGSNVTLTPDATNDKVTIAATDTTYSDATTSASGLMSASDKTKLNGIAAGAEVNVQANWTQTTTTADDYIKNKPTLATVATSGSYNDLSNKPTIPTVNNGTLTVTQNGTSKGTFTANQSGNSTIALTDTTYSAGTNIDITSNTIKTKTLGVEYIVGTQTGSTNVWTGISTDTGCSSSTIYTGKVIVYHLPYAGTSSAATLNLTLPDGTTTGAKNVKYNTGSNVGTTYGAGCDIFMVFDGSYWKCAPWYDSNNYDRIRHNTNVKAASAITSGQIIVGTDAGYKPVANGVTFSINYPILWAGSAINSGAANNNTYDAYPGVNLQSTKSGYTGTTYKMVFLVGTLSGTTFTVNSNIFTQTIPSSADSKVYAPIGLMTDSNKTVFFFPTNNYWEYRNGAFRPISTCPTLATVATSGSYNDLSNKPTIPAAQVNSDWNSSSGVSQILNKPTLATVATSGSYNDLSNKPTIPTVNNATLTIQKNGSTVKTFTANASSNVTANITVPTALSDLSGTVSSSQIADGAVTSSKIDWTTLGHHHATSSTQTTVNTSATTLLSFELTAGTWLLIGTSDFNHTNTATGDAFIGFQNLTANTEIGNRFYFNELNNGTYWSVVTAHEVVTLTGTANIALVAKKGQGTLYSTRKSFTAIRIG